MSVTTNKRLVWSWCCWGCAISWWRRKISGAVRVTEGRGHAWPRSRDINKTEQLQRFVHWPDRLLS
jgi:hypothetical protein